MLGGMDNRNRDSADEWPTQQLWPLAGGDGSGGHGPNPAAPAGPPPAGRKPRRLGRATRWGIGIAAVAVLAGGGVALASAGSSARPSGRAAGLSGQAATLNTVLSSADSPTTADAAAASPSQTRRSSGRPGAAVCARAAQQLKAAGRPALARRVRAACRGRLARLRLMVAGMHGEFTFQARKGGVKTLAFERGTVSSVRGGSVTVAASDGTTWTWHLVSDTVVRQGGRKVSASSLADGQQVFAGGPVVSGADNARLIVIRPAAGGR
jgi:hypothetical protein